MLLLLNAHTERAHKITQPLPPPTVTAAITAECPFSLSPLSNPTRDLFYPHFIDRKPRLQRSLRARK